MYCSLGYSHGNKACCSPTGYVVRRVIWSVSKYSCSVWPSPFPWSCPYKNERVKKTFSACSPIGVWAGIYKHWSNVAFLPLQFVFFKNTNENWFICRLNNSCKGLFTWSGGPRSRGVGFFCFHALADAKQKKPTPIDRDHSLHVNRV